MEKGRSQIKQLFTFILIIITIFLSSCQQIKNEDLLDEAKFEYENIKFEMNIDQIPFRGPILKNRVENFEPNPAYKIFAWYYLNKNDTIWIYAKVDTLLKRKTSIHFSKNIKVLIDRVN